MQISNFDKEKSIHILSSDIVDIWGLMGEPRPGHVLLHSEWHGPFTPERYKTVLSWLEQIKVAFNSPNVTHFSTVINKADEKGLKYVSLFGFKPDGTSFEDNGEWFIELRMEI